MERHPITAILLTCSTCGLVRMADDYGSAHARGNAHIRMSGHPKIQYSQIEAPERIKAAQMEAKASMERDGGRGRCQRYCGRSRYHRTGCSSTKVTLAEMIW